jgi:hypothetical protein
VETLPLVDDHARVVAAPPERTWAAVVAVVGGVPAVPGPLASAWGLEQPVRHGDWSRPAPGDAVPGFAVAQVDPPRTLALRGRHRFSRYELRFTLEPAGPGGTRVHARTAAAFPGVLGRGYRLAVIGSGGHALVVRRLLARVAQRAERAA